MTVLQSGYIVDFFARSSSWKDRGACGITRDRGRVVMRGYMVDIFAKGSGSGGYGVWGITGGIELGLGLND